MSWLYCKILLNEIEDIWNPSHEEIRAWAFSNDSSHEQNWDLAIAEFSNFDLMIEFANDLTLAKRKFFLSCLYVFVGDIVKSGELSANTNLKLLIEGVAENELSFDLKQWKERSLEILSDDSLYSYEFWGVGSKYV